MAHGGGGHGDTPASGQPLLSAPPAPLLLPGAWHPLPHTALGRAPGEQEQPSLSTALGAPAELEMCSPTWAWGKQPGLQQASPGARLSIAGFPRPFSASPAQGAPPGPTAILLHSTRGAPQWDMWQNGAGKRGMREEVVALGTAPLAVVTAMPVPRPVGVWEGCVGTARGPHMVPVPMCCAGRPQSGSS